MIISAAAMSRFSCHRIVALVTTLIIFSGSADAANDFRLRLTDVPIPHGTRVQWVGENIIQNGKPLQIARYDSSLNLTDTVAFYRQLWPNHEGTQAPPGLLETQTGEWLLLSHLQDGFNIVLQLHANNPLRSSGFLSIMPLDGGEHTEAKAEAADLQLLSETRSQDGSLSATLSVFFSEQSVSTTTSRLLHAHTRESWTLASRQLHADNQILILNHRSLQREIVVSRSDEGGSLVVINEEWGRE